MTMLPPTAGNAARYILEIFMERGCLPGERVKPCSFLACFQSVPWMATDLRAGIEYARSEGWLDGCGNLTEDGLIAAPDPA